MFVGNFLTGTVKWFDSKKGYGFIVCDDNDYFVHYKTIKVDGFKELKQNQLVKFTKKKGDKGWLAIDVEPI